MQTQAASSEIIHMVQIYTFKRAMCSVTHFEKCNHKSMAYIGPQNFYLFGS